MVKKVPNLVDLTKIVSLFEKKGLCEIDETVGEWRFIIPDLPICLMIKVVKTMSGGYRAYPNYTIQNPEQASPYASLSAGNSVEEVLIDTLSGFLLYWNPEKYEDKTKFEPIGDW